MTEIKPSNNSLAPLKQAKSDQTRTALIMHNRFYDSRGKKKITISTSQESIEAGESSIESAVTQVQLA